MTTEGQIMDDPDSYEVRSSADSIMSYGGVKPSAVTQSLVDQLYSRDAHGQAKYGKTLDRDDLTHSEWLQHMAEELMDGAGYALAAKRAHRKELLMILARCMLVAYDHIGISGRGGLREAGVNLLADAIRSELQS